MANSSTHSHIIVKVYHGYGHKHNLVLYGHVYRHKFNGRRRYTNNILSNILHLLGLFFVKPLAGVEVALVWGQQRIVSRTAADGFFKFEWASATDVPAGWHPVSVGLLDTNGEIVQTGAGQIFVPHITQYAFISDIDDTVMISHSATIFKRLAVLFTNNPRTRKAFADVVRHYKLLAEAHTEPGVPNPFFYVSSSEWNLYDDLAEFFRHNELPGGAFLLSQLKRWYQLVQTGKTKHEGKLLRVYRILEAFPQQRFVLLGDSSQSDPTIYQTICSKHPGKIFAVYVRDISEKKRAQTVERLAAIEAQGIHTCLFTDNETAIQHSEKIGLVIPQ